MQTTNQFNEIVDAARSGLITVPELLGFQERDGDRILRGAEALLARGASGLAAQLLQWLTSAKPYVARYWRAYGAALQDQDRPGDAARAYTAALAMDPDDLVARVNRGECCMMLGAVDRGLSDLQEALAAKSPDPRLTPWLGRARGLVELHLEGDDVAQDR